MKKLTRVSGGLILALGFAFLVPSQVSSDEPPPIPKEVKALNTGQLKKMFDAREKFLLVDSRIGGEYQEGRILTAIHVYDKEMESHKSKFPADKNSPIVFYCNGYPKCPRSVNAATIALGWGYKNIYVYLDGYPEWEKKGYPVERQ